MKQYGTKCKSNGREMEIDQAKRIVSVCQKDYPKYREMSNCSAGECIEASPEKLIAKNECLITRMRDGVR